MARSFHRKRGLQPNSELNVTALIDLGFSLLIIFMISTPLIEKEQILDLSLPVAAASAGAPEPDSVDVVVGADGYRVDGRAVSELELGQELDRIAQLPKAPVISIRADANTPYQNVVRALDLLKERKLQRINLITRPDE